MSAANPKNKKFYKGWGQGNEIIKRTRIKEYE